MGYCREGDGHAPHCAPNRDGDRRKVGRTRAAPIGGAHPAQSPVPRRPDTHASTTRAPQSIVRLRRETIASQCPFTFVP
ncbi:unnamed protein product [Leptosia nina]|uniref:Uncharacterized protein n=1 Tax=Leptosia nina TaxID=320188 RepID=A0AAV1J6Q1_9NEOP